MDENTTDISCFFPSNNISARDFILMSLALSINYLIAFCYIVLLQVFSGFCFVVPSSQCLSSA